MTTQPVTKPDVDDPNPNPNPGPSLTAGPGPNSAPAVKRAPAPPFVIETVQESDDFIKLFVYGAYDTGKTWLAGSSFDCPPMHDILYIDAEGGRRTIRDWWPDMQVVRINTFSQVSRLREFLSSHCYWRDSDAPEAEQKLIELENKVRNPRLPPITVPHRYRTVVIDSLSEVQAYCFYHITGVKLETQRMDDVMGKGGYDEFDQLLQAMRLCVRQYRDLPMHVILLSGEVIKADEKNRQHQIPNFSGKLVFELPGFFDLVGHYRSSPPDERGLIRRRLQLKRTETADSKSRFRRLQAPYLDDPTMTAIMHAAGFM